MPHKLSQFWQELKRRKVTRVLTVYIAVAFMLLELVDMISEPFGLPEWSMKVGFFILLGGLFVTLIMSWLYDIHPEGGMVKTEPAYKAQSEDIPKSSNSWKIATYISFVVIVGLIVLNVIPRSNNRKALEKSIAVLPLEYLSEDPNKEYLANGVLDAITGHLSLIEGLRVMPRTSVEQYRENKKSAKQIGEELDVSYLIEGSFLMIEDQVKLIIQLVVAEEGDHVFYKEYDRNYKDIIVVQSEVAKTIAKEIEVAITPEEKLRIEKIPTTNLLAHEFYQRGRNQFVKFRITYNIESLKKGADFFRKAIKLDSTFAQAYTGLALTYYYFNSFADIFSENYLDSLIILADAALNYDNQLAEAHTIKGLYYSNRAQPEKALAEFDMAIDLNPNDWMAYENKGFLYVLKDLVKSLDNYHKAANLNRGEGLLQNLTVLHVIYGCVLGMEERGAYYARQILELSEDSAKYYQSIALQEQFSGNYERSSEYYKRAFALDSSRIVDPGLGHNAFMLRKFEEAHTYYKQLFEAVKESRDSSYLILYYNVYGYLLWGKGYPGQAEKYFDKYIEYNSNIIELGGRGFEDSFESHFELASVYAFRGEKEKAFEHLKLFNQRELMILEHATLLKYSPLFDNIRDEPEFQQIVRDVESKHQAEYERVRLWLEENEML